MHIYVLLVESHQFEIAVRLLNQGGKVPCWRDQTSKVRSNNQRGEIKHLSSHFCGIFSAIRHHIGFWTHLVADHLFSPNLKEKTELSPFENGYLLPQGIVRLFIIDPQGVLIVVVC